MATMTLELTVENLENDELDNVEKAYSKFFKEPRGLPGRVTDVTETDREEDEETEGDD